MSLYKDASLAMIPTAYKDGKLYSVRPTDGSGDFTFSRGSNLSATRVDASQLIEKGRENILLQSQSFDNASWLKTRNSVTANVATAPDGTNTADKIAADSTFNTNTSRVQQYLNVSGVNTISVYAKADSITEMMFYAVGPGNGITFNLTNGSFVSYYNTQTNIIDYKIEDAGNGWYRYSITFSATNTRTQIYLSKGGNITASYTINEGFFVWGGQSEQGLVATPYIETGASTAQAGILENTPRLDYSGGATCPSLLLEPSRTNIVTQSEWFEDWALSRTSSFGSGSVINDTTSPEGVVNATYIQQASGQTSGGGVYGGYSYTSGTTYTLSVFAKKKENRYARIGFGIGQSGGAIFCGFDLQDGVAGAPNTGITPKIEDYGNGWYRCSITATAQTSGARNTFLYQSSNLDDFTTIPLNGIYIYGAQLEQGSYPTSYIPTYGVSQTRAADITSAINVSSIGVTTNYTLFYELGDFNVSVGATWLSQASNSGAPYQVYGNTAVIKTSTGDVYPFSHGNIGTQFKVAVSFDGTNINVFTNGVKRGTWIANSIVWSSFGNLYLNLSPVQMVNWKQLLVFPTALTDSEAIALTTI